MTACKVELRGISHSFFDDSGYALDVLDDLSLEIGAGEFVSVVGPSGCGKSTLLRIVGGLLEPGQGEVLVDGEPPRRAQQKSRVGYVFQEPALLPWRNVRRNVELPLEIADRAVATNGSTSADLLDLVGLTEFAGYPPRHLSGGMRQRVAIARALALDPALLLMDEPFGALDEITREEMRLELQRIWGKERKTVVFVTHSIREAALVSDRVVVLSSRPGRIVESVDVHLPRPRDETIEMDPAFVALLTTLREALRAGLGPAPTKWAPLKASAPL
jgi:NitT/TauT family transport system ATP-binding protein